METKDKAYQKEAIYDGEYTLIGMKHYDHTFFMRLLRDKAGLFIKGIAAKNPDYENGIDVYAIDDLDKILKRIGTLSTNYELDGTKNGADFDLEQRSYVPIMMKIGVGDFRTGEALPVRTGLRIVELTTINCGADTMKEVFLAATQNKDLTTSKYNSYRLVGLGHKYYSIDDWRRIVVEMQGSSYSSDQEPTKNKPIEQRMQELLTKTNTAPTNTIIEEEGKPMKKNFLSKFGADFNYPTENFAVSLFGGGLAVKTKDGFVTFDGAEAIDVMDFVIEDMNEFIMIMPAQKLEDGDIFVQNGEVYQMITAEVNEVYSYSAGSIISLVDKKNAFGFKMHAKVMNLMGNMFGGDANAQMGGFNPMIFMLMDKKDGDNGMGDMMKYMMMSQMFSNTKK